MFLQKVIILINHVIPTKIFSQGKTELRGLEDEAEITVPKFITKIQSRAVAEGEPVHFSCRVEPKHDPKLNITWYKNEQELAAGSRFRITQEFGYVALDILYTYPEDEGNVGVLRKTNSCPFLGSF